MVITEVEPLSRTRYKVYIDGKFAFVLYKGDLARYHLARGCEIPEETCRQIRREVVLKRAKMRALHLLNDMAWGGQRPSFGPSSGRTTIRKRS